VLATETGIDPQLIDVPNAMTGTYSMVIESIAPGGDFVATASALDASGSLSFNYALSGGGAPGTKFGSTLTVESGTAGALRASGSASWRSWTARRHTSWCCRPHLDPGRLEHRIRRCSRCCRASASPPVAR